MTGAGEANRYVDTKAIRDAVRGREAEILNALDINWHSGRPHFNAPTRPMTTASPVGAGMISAVVRTAPALRNRTGSLMSR
jgi:hypothetical protein